MQEYIKILGSGTITLITSNGEMKYIMKIVTSLEDSSLLIKESLKQFKMKQKNKKKDFLVCF